MDYERLVEESQYEYKKKLEMTNICLQYVIAKKLVVFGGLAIDFALKLNKCGGIYEDYKLMDIDVFSNKHYNDAHELLEIFINLGYENCDLMVAMHPTSVRVRIDHYMLLDVAYIPDDIYKLYTDTALSYKTDFGTVLFRHPYIQVLDIHRSFSYPYENKPMENIKNRFYKDYERYIKLIDCYPFLDDNIKYITFATESGISSDRSNNSNKNINEYTIDKSGYIHGVIAYLFYEHIFNNHILTYNNKKENNKKENKKEKENKKSTKNKLDIKNNSVSLIKGYHPLYMVRTEYLNTIKTSSSEEVTNYYKYMDIIPEITKIGTTKYFKIVPGNEPGYIEYEDYKIINIHFVMLWLLHSWLVKKDSLYIEMYKNLLDMIHYISSNYEFDIITESEDMLKFFPSIKVDFIDEEINVVMHEVGEVPTNIYFNKIEGKTYEFQSFDYAGKKLFQINGKRIPKNDA